MSFAAILAGIIVVAGFLLWLAGRRSHRATGIPSGDVVYSDTNQWKKQEKPLRSRRYGIVGRPDYLVRVVEAGEIATVPVEVKSRSRPPAPYESHVLQLAAYCLLVEDVLKERPPYGLLRYADATVRIPYTEDLRQQVLAVAEQIRRARHAPSVARQHADAARCRACGYRAACGDEALA